MTINIITMRTLFLGVVISAFSCCGSKNMATAENPVAETNKKGADVLPACIQKLIADFKNDPVSNPPRKIYSYTYNNKTVYYVQPVCCDNFSDLYDGNCTLLAHPDGGFTGRGDGKLPDFKTAKSNEKLVWEDERGK